MCTAPERWTTARAVLGFDPSREPERLTAKPNDAVTDAKRVLRFLLLAEGDQLAPGIPASIAPAAEDADQMSAALCARLHKVRDMSACGLQSFLDDLRRVVRAGFTEHLPTGGSR